MDGFVMVCTQLALWSVLWLDSVQVIIKCYVLGSESKNGALISSCKVVDVVIKVRAGHMGVHLSSCVSYGPSVQPHFFICCH